MICQAYGQSQFKVSISHVFLTPGDMPGPSASAFLLFSFYNYPRGSVWQDISKPGGASQEGRGPPGYEIPKRDMKNGPFLEASLEQL